MPRPRLWIIKKDDWIEAGKFVKFKLRASYMPSPSQLIPVSFIKMHGLGNDFVVIDDLKCDALTPMTAFLAKRLCDRRFGVGADQLLWVRAPVNHQLAHARMEIWNADGSTAEMCGNGIRAVALQLFRHGPQPGLSTYSIETGAGVLTVSVREPNQVKVNMGVPTLGSLQGEWITVGDQKWKFFEVHTGNPHAVIFVDSVSDFPIEKIGPCIETHSRFPKRTNVEFVQILDSEKIQVRVWERGAGPTLACGTGACASAVAAIHQKKTNSRVEVHLPGGRLQIEWAGLESPVWMEGPAEAVFEGKMLL